LISPSVQPQEFQHRAGRLPQRLLPLCPSYPDARPDGGHATGRVRVRRLCPPYEAVQPYRRVANPWKLFRQTVAAAASLAVTHPPRKSRLLPHEKNAPQFCLRFVATKSHDVNVRRGAFLTTRLKRLTRKRISHHTARRSRRAASPHAAQVLQATMDFGARASARLVMRIKRLKRRNFSLSSARWKSKTAFSSPQRA
jgi:hypothetical protein